MHFGRPDGLLVAFQYLPGPVILERPHETHRFPGLQVLRLPHADAFIGLPPRWRAGRAGEVVGAVRAGAHAGVAHGEVEQRLEPVDDVGAGDPPQRGRLGRITRRAARPQEVMEPHLGIGGRAGGRAPGKLALRAAVHEAPVVTTDLFPLEHGKIGLEPAAPGAGHPLGAEHGAAVRLQCRDARLEAVGVAIEMEADDVGKRHLPLADFLRRAPDADGQRLGGAGLARPAEGGFHERQTAVAQARVAGLVVQIPHDDAAVPPERAHQVLDVALQVGPGGRVGHEFESGAGHPAGVVHSRHRVILFAGVGIAIPVERAVVEQHGHDAQAVAIRHFEELLEAFPERARVLFPDDVLHKYAAGVEAEASGPGQFAVDGDGIERLRLPHLGVIDRAAGHEVEADEPRLVRLPRAGLRLGPALRGGPTAGADAGAHAQQDGSGKEKDHGGRAHVHEKLLL